MKEYLSLKDRNKELKDQVRPSGSFHQNISMMTSIFFVFIFLVEGIYVP